MTATEPIATPTEKVARNSVATVWSAPSAFLTSGGNWAASTAPIAQKKLMAMIARNRRGMCSVLLTSVRDARMMCQSKWKAGCVGGGRGRRDEMTGNAADAGHRQHRNGRQFGMEAAVRLLQHEHAAEQRPAEDADIGAGLDQSGCRQHLVGLEQCCGRMAYLIGPKKVE